MVILIILTIVTILSGLTFSIYALVINELSLLISSLSVIAASISGLIAIMVLKANKDKERPFLIVKPNYNRYGIIQISIENYGTEIAIIKNVKVDNKIYLLGGEDFFEQIIETTIPPGDSINFLLITLENYQEKNKRYFFRRRN